MVLDPVLVCRKRMMLLSASSVRVDSLFPYVTVITPNLPEAELLAVKRLKPGTDMKAAAQKLHDLGAPAVIMGWKSYRSDKAVDVFYDGEGYTILENQSSKG